MLYIKINRKPIQNLELKKQSSNTVLTIIKLSSFLNKNVINTLNDLDKYWIIVNILLRIVFLLVYFQHLCLYKLKKQSISITTNNN